VHGPSAIVDEEFAWTDAGWKGVALSDMVIYELHTGTFTDEGNFGGIISRLGYLKNLGINTIELMPVAQFPGSRNWGYDGVYPFAVQDSYGGSSGLKELVNAAHANGIAVILDVVYNHLGPEGTYFNAFGPYFTDKYKTNWGKAINFDDAWCDGVRHYYWQNALMWLSEYHIDGLRLDAVHSIWDNSAPHFIEVLVRKVKALEEKTGTRKVLIAEFDLNNPRYIQSPSAGGYGLDGQWADEFHHALHSLVTGEKDGYYEDFGDIVHLERSFRDSYVYSGQYSVHRKKTFGMQPVETGYDQFVVFSQNHDQIGNRMLGDRLSTHLSFESLKVAAAAVIFSPHVPMLFMGEEYGEKRPFQYFISHTDEELIRLIRKGRKEEFSYFKWEGELPDPQDEKTFRQCVLSWNHLSGDGQALHDYYKHIIGLRLHHAALRSRSRDSLQLASGDGQKLIAFTRKAEDERLLVVLNFEKAVSTLDAIDLGIVRKIFDSSSTNWKGPGEIDNAGNSRLIRINPESAVIYECNKI
jgi:maltooligosyltrehalose trehalohydrolase